MGFNKYYSSLEDLRLTIPIATLKDIHNKKEIIATFSTWSSTSNERNQRGIKSKSKGISKTQTISWFKN